MLFLEGSLITLHPVPMKFTIVKKAVAMGPRSGGGGYLLTFNTRGSVCIFGVQNLTLNQYLWSVSNKIDKNSIFGGRKIWRRKNHAVWRDLWQ